MDAEKKEEEQTGMSLKKYVWKTWTGATKLYLMLSEAKKMPQSVKHLP